MRNRLNEILNYSNLPVLRFSKNCGLHQATVDKQLKGFRNVSVDTLIAVGKSFPEISMEWLVLGKGEMLKENNQTEIEMAHKTIADLQSVIADQALTIKYLKDRIKELETK